MLKYTLAHDYQDSDNKPLRLYVRFLKRSAFTHVSQGGNATPFLSREEATAALPKKGGYHVEPKPRPKSIRKKKEQKPVEAV